MVIERLKALGYEVVVQDCLRCSVCGKLYPLPDDHVMSKRFTMVLVNHWHSSKHLEVSYAAGTDDTRGE